MLDSNQRDREQMCRAVLALASRFSEVRPRHQNGGKDGGRDIEAVMDGDRTAFGAVGFMNGANDSNYQKNQIRKKFRSDLASAVQAKTNLKVFVFFTNVGLTISDKEKMKAEARKSGIEHCDVLDRERLRIELDSPSGYFIRFQYLGIPLSPEEQASFLSRYGDQLQDVLATGFSSIEKTLRRLLFLQEPGSTLDSIHVRISLKETYLADEVLHFRAYWLLSLRGITHGIFRILAASSDRSCRFAYDNANLASEEPGIRYGIASGRWEDRIRTPSPNLKEEVEGADEGETTSQTENMRWMQVGYGSKIGCDSVPHIDVSYHHDDELIRFRPRLQLRDLDEGMFMPILNRSLAEKVSSLDVYANGYQLLAIGPGDFRIDDIELKFTLPGEYTPEELADPWVRIRPASWSSAFHLRFASQTPRRAFGHDEVTGSTAHQQNGSDGA